METLCEIRVFVSNDEHERELAAAAAEKAEKAAAAAEEGEGAVKLEDGEEKEEEDEDLEEETAAQVQTASSRRHAPRQRRHRPPPSLPPSLTPRMTDSTRNLFSMFQEFTFCARFSLSSLALAPRALARSTCSPFSSVSVLIFLFSSSCW